MARRPSTATPGSTTPAPFTFKNTDYFAKTESKRKKWRTAKQILADSPTSTSPSHHHAPPSLRPPPARYCDVTGLRAPYCDPKTGLWYSSAAVYQHIRGLSPNAVQALLAIRRSNVEI